MCSHKNLVRSVFGECTTVSCDVSCRTFRQVSACLIISDENKITLNFHVIVAYGVSISAVTDNLISNVKYKVEEFTGMSVDKINIYIEGVRVID